VNALRSKPGRHEQAVDLGSKNRETGTTTARTRAPKPGIVATEGGGLFNPSLMLGGGTGELGTAAIGEVGSR
jgi:hypothetical protein